MALHRMDCLSSHGDLSLYEFARRRYESTARGAGEAGAAGDRARSDCGGVPAGAGVQGMLPAVEDAQLEGRIRARDEGLALVLAGDVCRMTQEPWAEPKAGPVGYEARSKSRCGVRL